MVKYVNKLTYLLGDYAMNDNTFGEYLRILRLSRDPVMTQEALAKAIGRGKMTISQFEQGKNSPPQGDLLNKIIQALNLTQEEEAKLRFLSAKARKDIPADIEDYFFSTPEIYATIRAAMKRKKVVDWEIILDELENKDE